MKKLISTLLVLTLTAVLFCAMAANVGAEDTVSPEAEATVAESSESSVIGTKAISAGIAIALAAAVGAVSMAIAISKSAASIARQPEASGEIRTSMMLGLVFIETCIIYALIVAILIIFVL